MSGCTFFGHRDCPASIRPALREAVVSMIHQHNADVFYVGHQGTFDRMVRGILRELAAEYPHIRYWIVLAYLPGQTLPLEKDELARTLFPEGLESVPPRFAIHYRNQWMIEHSQHVITCIRHPQGGAAAFAKRARKLGCHVVNVP